MSVASSSARIAATLLALAAAPVAALAQAATPRAQAQPPSARQLPPTQPFQTLLERESRSRELCEAAPDRVFVRYRDGTECVAFASTTGQPRTATTVLFFQGDVSPEQFETLKTHDAARNFIRSAQGITNRFDVRIIFVSRPGTFGTSGNHGRRRTEYEMLVMNAAVDAIKSRLGLGTLVLVGQSGGSTVAAALMALGRTDVACIVLGSGGQNVTGNFRRRNPDSRVTDTQIQRTLFDPTARTSDVRTDPRRRVFVLGDPTDTVTPYDLQIVYAQRLRNAGHHAVAFKIRARGDMMHGAVDQAIPAAARCARGDNDATIFQAAAADPRQPLDVGPASAPPATTPPPVATRSPVPVPAPIPPIAALPAPQRPASPSPSRPTPPSVAQPPAARAAPLPPGPAPVAPIAALPPTRPAPSPDMPAPLALPPSETPRAATPQLRPEAPRAPVWLQQPGGILGTLPVSG